MASSSSYSQSIPASSSSPSCNYDVFLSFRGEDTRKTFVDHFYTALKSRQIHVYKDDETLPRGESIAPALFKAIEGSEIAVIIFSKNYANSSWCLEELTHIMKCKQERNLIVTPIFYGVDPSDVRKQKETFEEAFGKHKLERNDKVESWKKALVDASNIAGWEPQKMANGHESKSINEIADDISHKLSFSISDVDEEFVGMGVRLHELEEQLQIGSGGVRMIGIWGIGGGGKTTQANSLCTKISNRFEAYCIIDNIREESIKHGLKSLQEKMLSTLLKTKMELQSIHEGKRSIQRRLKHSNVLILLDDVDHNDQLDALVGSHSWFGSGSRIVITTRNEQLLTAHRVDQVYPVKLLTNEEAIQLFHRKAYNEKVVVKDYEKLSLSVVSYANGLPLALKVLGSFLNGQEEKVWRDTLDRLKNTPELEIVGKLKISYDGLQNDEKELFLDIACFLLGWKKIEGTFGAMEKLEAFDYHPVRGIRVLKQKALIRIDKHGRLNMHDLVRDMAHYIVRGEHPNNPEKHSRVWKSDEIKNMFLRDATLENDKTEVIYTYDDFDVHPSYISKSISKMKKLRWITMFQYGEEDSEGPDFLSNELRYIDWCGYPRSPFPESFQPINLVVLKLYKSLQKELWKDCKRLPHLKVLCLKYMKNLVKTPRFDELPCLEKLVIDTCRKLEEIHQSLGNHGSLKYVEVSGCDKVGMLPTIIKMENLKTLRIFHHNLDFPEIKSNMERLETLSLMGVRIDALLSSIEERCANLTSLKLVKCVYFQGNEPNFDGLKHLKEFTLERLNYPVSLRHRRGNQPYIPVFLQMASSLQELYLSGCGLRDGEIPAVVGELSNLLVLDLSYNDFTRLHLSLLQLTRLRSLDLSSCKNLIQLPELPSDLVSLVANYCISLTTIGDIHGNCKWLCKVLLMNGGIITDGGMLLLESMLQGNATEYHPMFLRVKGVEIAKSFLTPLHKGCEYNLTLPENWCNDFCGFLVCAVGGGLDFTPLEITIKRQVSGKDSIENVVWKQINYDAYYTTIVHYIPFSSLRETKWWDESHKVVLFSMEGRTMPDGFGVRMVPRKSGSDLIIPTLTTNRRSPLHPYELDVVRDSTDALIIGPSWLITLGIFEKFHQVNIN